MKIVFPFFCPLDIFPKLSLWLNTAYTQDHVLGFFPQKKKNIFIKLFCLFPSENREAFEAEFMKNSFLPSNRLAHKRNTVKKLYCSRRKRKINFCCVVFGQLGIARREERREKLIKNEFLNSFSKPIYTLPLLVA